MSAGKKEPSSRVEYQRNLARVLLLLLGAVIGCLAVMVASRWMQRREARLSLDAARIGAERLAAGQYGQAVEAYETALGHARGNEVFTLGLAESLLGQGRLTEARDYLLHLREKQPENGEVNLVLARIAVRQGRQSEVEKYYHSAIYATWPTAAARQQARFELIDYLLRDHESVQAEAELMALAANMGNNRPLRMQLAELFTRAGDLQRTLVLYKQVLSVEPHNREALLGAGKASFALGDDGTAAHFYEQAAESGVLDPENAERWKLAERTSAVDPYQRNLDASERILRMRVAFTKAGALLKGCTIPAEEYATVFVGLQQQWDKLRPRVTTRVLRSDIHMQEDTMKLVFSIERAAADRCVVSEDDRALLRTAERREEN